MSLYLVGIDGSAGGERALEAAIAMAGESQSRLLLVYVIAWSPFSFSTPEENAERHRRREEELAIAHSKLLQPLLEKVQAQSIPVEGLATHGHPARKLASLAEEHAARMIIVARSGDKPIKSRFFGGTASALTQSAGCPVLVVP